MLQYVRSRSQSGLAAHIAKSTLMSSRPEESHPPGAPKTVREPLDSHGSRCSTVGTRATGFTSSTGSSCCQMASVGPWPRLNNAAPSVQPHYRAFIPTTGHSAPVLRIGTLVLAVLAACDLSLCIGATGSHVPYKSQVELRAAYMPDATRAGFRATPELVPGDGSTPGFDIV